MRYYPGLLEWLCSKRQEISVSKDVKKREPLCTVRGNENWCSHYKKQHGVCSKFFQKFLKMELLYYSGHLYEGNEITIFKRYLTPLCTVTLFTIAKTWKQPECLFVDEWIKNVWCIYIYATECYSLIKTERNPDICDNKNGTWGHYVKWNKSLRKRQCDNTYI